jgi:hypothetical protein
MNPQEYFLPSLPLLFTIIDEIIADYRLFVNTGSAKIFLGRILLAEKQNRTTVETGPYVAAFFISWQVKPASNGNNTESGKESKEPIP